MKRMLQRFDQSKRMFCLIMLILLSVAVFVYGALSLFGAGYVGMVVLFLVGGLFGIVYMVALYRETLLKDGTVEKLFLFSIIVLSLGYMVCFPPVAVPDEHVHYMSAYRLSNFFLLKWEQIGNSAVLARSVDVDFFQRFASSNVLDINRYRLLAEQFSVFAPKCELQEFKTTIGTNAPFGYFASALGIALGRVLHLGAVPVFYLGRMFNMAQYVLLAYWAMKIMPFGKIVIYVISMLPMMLHLCASYSYDCMIVGVAMLLIAEVMSMIYGEEIRKRHLVTCAALCFILAPSKLVYTPLICCVFLIPSEKLARVCKYPNICKVLLVLAGIAGLMLLQLTSMSGYVETEGNYIAWAGEEGYTLSMVFEQPLAVARLFCNTMIQKADYYFQTFLGAGLGWFQIWLPMYLYLPFGLMLLLACWRRKEEPAALVLHEKSWIFLLVLGSYMLVLASMFLSWTPISSSVIQGVQGRYFLPLMPCVFLLLRGNVVELNRSVDRYIIFFAGMLNVFVLSHVYLSVL